MSGRFKVIRLLALTGSTPERPLLGPGISNERYNSVDNIMDLLESE